MSNTTTQVLELLETEYYSLGVESGHEALGNLLEDWSAGYLTETLTEWGVTETEFPAIVVALGKKFIDEEKMWTPHELIFDEGLSGSHNRIRESRFRTFWRGFHILP